MNLLITGANGFLGSHLVTLWLARYPKSRVLCLIRGGDDRMVRKRLQAALGLAITDTYTVDADAGMSRMLDRVDVIRGDVNDTTWTGRACALLRGPTELIHCAAHLSFSEADRLAVWRTNVDGTTTLLRALADLPGIVAFNHISTAYVAGNRQGLIQEDETQRPACFNNPYEESKWTAEALVREHCAAIHLPWRILRPSIIVAHSVTHRISSHSGLYQVMDTLLRLGRKADNAAARVIGLPVEAGATLDLIPVDVVADEVVATIAANTGTINRTFHITNPDPLRLDDVLRELTPMSGVSIEATEASAASSPAAKLLMRRLRHYMPYFGLNRRFDQADRQVDVSHRQYRMDIEKLRTLMHSYVESKKSFAVISI